MHVTIESGFYLIDTEAWIAQRVGPPMDSLTTTIRDFIRHDVFHHCHPPMSTAARIELWCHARGHAVADTTPTCHDDPSLTKPMTVVLAAIGQLAIAIVWVDSDEPTVYPDLTTDAHSWHSVNVVDIVCPLGHRFTWASQDIFDEHGRYTTVTDLFGSAGPLVECRDCHAFRSGASDTDCDCGTRSAIYCPRCAQRCQLHLPDVATIDSAAPNGNADE